MKLLIRNLSRSTTEETLHALFSNIGAVQSCNLVMDQSSGQSKGFAFVEMPKIGEAKIAIHSLNNSELEGNKIRVKKADVADKAPAAEIAPAAEKTPAAQQSASSSTNKQSPSDSDD